MFGARPNGPNPQGSLSTYVSLLLVAAVYFLAAKLGLRLAYLHPSASPVWPPTGIALGALLVLGPRTWPAIWTGAFLANLTTAGSLATSVGIATGNTAEALLGTLLVNRFAGGRAAMERPWNIFKFAVLAAGLSTMMSATIGVLSLSLGGFVQPGAQGVVWLTWWLGDLVGDLMAAPLVLLWSADRRLGWTAAQTAEAALILLVVVGTGVLMFGGLIPPYPLTFLCLPVLLWPAFRLGPREAATSATILGAIAVDGTLRGYGTFTHGSPNESLLLLQSFMGVCSLTAIAVAAVVAERKRLEARLLHLADYDSLTEVLSRRRFKEELAHQLAKSLRYDSPAALLFVDLDDFKSINDRLGHAAGDRVLASVARLLRGRLRESDVMGRMGGDEFAVLLPRADGRQATAVAELLVKEIGAHATVVDERRIVTAGSIGIAMIPDHGTSVDELLAHADAAMFAAKAAGGRCCRTYAPDSDTPGTATRRDERSRRR
jgi:diguanylate cyclase (GGDEF)-like protein